MPHLLLPPTRSFAGKITTPHEAQDLTQEFFHRFLAKDYLASVAREKGKFRSFLLASLKHFLGAARVRESAIKRGGRHTLVPLDEGTVEERYLLDAKSELTPEMFYDRGWATTLMERALSGLGEDFQTEGKADLFERLRIFRSREPREGEYAAVAQVANMTSGAVSVAVHRMRQRYGDRRHSSERRSPRPALLHDGSHRGMPLGPADFRFAILAVRNFPLPVTVPLTHEAPVLSAQFSPDGQRVVTAADDGAVRVWDARRGNRLLDLPRHVPDWLPELAESLAVKQLDLHGRAVSVAANRLADLRREFESVSTTNFYPHWAKWFFADRQTRAASPFTQLTAPDQLGGSKSSVK